MIGTLGNYTFEVSSKSVRNFDALSFQNSVSYAEHKIIGRKSLLEFTGLNPSSASLSITLDVTQGTDPLECISSLYEAMNKHEALAFTLGGEVMGQGLWVIESLGEKYDIISAKGKILRAAVDLNLKEYLENASE